MMRSAHLDTFCGDGLPPREQWPTFLFEPAELRYPERINCVVELLDHWVRIGHGDRLCLVSPDERLSYAQVAERVNRIANVLTRDLGIVPGNRVLLRGPNSPMMVAAYLAVMKAGAIAVATMPLLRAKEIAFPIEKARISLALCDYRLADELEKARTLTGCLGQIVYWGDPSTELERLMNKAGYELFAACQTASDDICLIGFTSGTTGEPKATLHFHRDLLATCDSYGRHVLRATAQDRFIGSPPIAFTFGLGGLVLFPFRVGAAAILLEQAAPAELLAAIEHWGASVCFTAPTAYRGMLAKLKAHDVSSLRTCVSAGEPLPKVTFDRWQAATGVQIMDGIGATEMLHIFIGSPADAVRPGATGKPVPGYQARVIDASGRELPAGAVGRLAVRGSDRLPLPRRRAAERSTCKTAGMSPVILT